MRDLGVKNDVGQVYAGGVEQKIILKYVHHSLQGRHSRLDHPFLPLWTIENFVLD